MNKPTLKNILQSAYDRTQWISTLQFLTGKRELLTVNLSPIAIDIHTKEADRLVKSFHQIGAVKTSDGVSIPIFEVILEDAIKIEYNRVGVNEFIKKYIIKDAVKGALVTFSYDENHEKTEWRFSFISKNSASDFFAEAEAQETNPKKFTYIFGTEEEHRTAIERLYNLEQSRFRLEDFFEAFNVEPVSKKFFEEYKHLYREFSDYIIVNYRELFVGNSEKDEKERNKKTEKEIRNFVGRLLGRIVFLYFLQKKNWLGASNTEYNDGSTSFLSDLFFNDVENQEDFYSKYLCPVFFNALNTADRKNDEFKLENGKIVCIPFLNGGLFEEEQEPIKHRTTKFPAHYFKMLFDFFNGFNFTVYENSPEEHTVAVDPEMLGHIFENLIDYNKDTGTFYTPKEIVQYMTQESLAEYLNTHLEKDRTEIENIIKNQSATAFSDAELSQINTLLDDVKICDPAIGSGAFPMGMLQEIFNLKALINYRLGFELWSPATVKQNIIQNSIYGVDLDEGAVEIARLRFWLSLVVDEGKPKALPNLDYKIMQGNSLLESYKGIDLSGISKLNDLKIIEDLQTDLFGHLVDNQMKMTVGKSGLAEEIQKLIKKYFTAKSEEKQKIKTKIENKIAEHIEFNIELRENQLYRQINELEENIKNLKPTQKKALEKYKTDLENLMQTKQDLKKEQKQKEKSYFLWHLFFGDVLNNGGFDIVIGNPPYIQLQKEGGKLANQFENSNFLTFERTGDIYALFYEKGINLLSEKGTLCYITSNKWMRANYGSSLRQFFVDKTYPLLLLDFGNIQVFKTATVDTNILLLQKKLDRSKHDYIPTLGAKLTKDFILKSNSLAEFVKNNGYELSALSQNSWVIGEKDIYDIKGFVEKQGTALKYWDLEIYRGVVTGYNEAFVIDEKTKNQLIKEDTKSKEIIKPMLRGKDVDSWYPKDYKLWLINAHNGVKSKNITSIQVEKDYPAIYNWLSKYKGLLLNRQDKGEHWTNLRNCAYVLDFLKPKIMYRDITQEFDFAYVEDEFYGNNTVYMFVGDHLKFLTCFLNSSLFSFCFKDNFTDLGSKGRRLFTAFFKEIPVKLIENTAEKPFELILDALVELKKQNLKDSNDLFMLSYFEQISDALIFELYFKDEFQKNKLSIFENLVSERLVFESNFTEKERLVAIRKLYINLYQEHHPVRQGVSQMLSIPQVQLVKNSLLQ